MTRDKLIGYFGYGSLVNRKTLRTTYVDVARGELTGFRREWRIRGETPRGPVCSLTATQDEQAVIQGLLVIDRVENLPKVDEREFRYDRVSIPARDLDLEHFVEVEEVYVYLAKPVHRGENDARFPIWQSYVDAVMQGYLTEFGEAGLERFVTDTFGWNRNILTDRDAPNYARAVQLSERERSLFDSLLHSQHHVDADPGAV